MSPRIRQDDAFQDLNLVQELYTVRAQGTYKNWIWTDKLQPGTRCRRCDTWWKASTKATGKGKGQGHGQRHLPINPGQTWPKKTYEEALMDTPPGLNKLKPLKKAKDQQTAAELLAFHMGCHSGRDPEQVAGLGFWTTTAGRTGAN